MFPLFKLLGFVYKIIYIKIIICNNVTIQKAAFDVLFLIFLKPNILAYDWFCGEGKKIK